MVKSIFIGIIFVFFSPVLLSLEIAVADVYLTETGQLAQNNKVKIPFTQEEEIISRQILSFLEREDYLHLINFTPVYKEIRNNKEAITYLQNHEQEYLLYGFYRKDASDRVILEISLYDNNHRSVRKIFTVVDNPKYLEKIYRNVAEQIMLYLYTELNHTVFMEKRLHDGFSFLLNVGYGSPVPIHEYFTGTGVVGMELKYRIPTRVDQKPRFPFVFPYFLGHVSYGLFLNQPNYNSLLFHQIRFGAGAGVGLEFYNRHLLLFDIRYSSEIGILSLEKINDNNKTQILHASGGAVSLGYEHWVNKIIGFGIYNQFHLLLYRNNLRYSDYRLLLALHIAIPSSKEKSRTERLPYSSFTKSEKGNI